MHPQNNFYAHYKTKRDSTTTNYFDDLILSLEHLTDVADIESFKNWYCKLSSMKMKTVVFDHWARHSVVSNQCKQSVVSF